MLESTLLTRIRYLLGILNVQISPHHERYNIRENTLLIASDLTLRDAHTFLTDRAMALEDAAESIPTDKYRLHEKSL